MVVNGGQDFEAPKSASIHPSIIKVIHMDRAKQNTGHELEA